MARSKMKRVVKSGYKKKTIVFPRRRRKKQTACKHAANPDFVPRHTLQRRELRALRKEKRMSENPSIVNDTAPKDGRKALMQERNKRRGQVRTNQLKESDNLIQLKAV